MQIQLERYAKVLAEIFYPGVSLKEPETWMDAFEQLNQAIKKNPKSKKVILFFDEFFWLSTRKSGAIQVSSRSKISLFLITSSCFEKLLSCPLILSIFYNFYK